VADAQMSSRSNVSSPDVLVDPSNDSARTMAGRHSSGPSVQQGSTVDRIVVGCPNCHATLRVRRVYLGNSVRCKNCDQVFLFEEPPDSVSKPAGDLEIEELQKTLRSKLDAEQTNERDIRQLSADRDSLRAEVGRLCDENRDLRADQMANAQLAAELQRHVADLASARDALDRLHTEKQAAIDEVEEHRKTIADRDQALLDQSDQHRTALERERLAREDADQCYRESVRRIQEEHQSAEAARRRLQDECLETAAALEKLRRDHELELDAEQTKQKALMDELLPLRADAEETTRLANQLIAMKTSPADQNPAPDSELEAARARIDELNRRLMISDRVINEMVEILDGLGIRMRLPAR
jgi:chromosome segregation ATPase